MEVLDEKKALKIPSAQVRPKSSLALIIVLTVIAGALSAASMQYGMRCVDVYKLTFAFGQLTDGGVYYLLFGLLLVSSMAGVATTAMLLAEKPHRFIILQKRATTAFALILSILTLTCIFTPHQTHWGPLQVPFEESTKIIWWTEQAEQTRLCADGKLYYSNGFYEDTRVLDSCGAVVDVAETEFHQVIVDSTDFTYELFNANHIVDNMGRDEVKFLLMADMRQNEKYMKRATRDAQNFDFVVSQGDMTANATLKQLYSTYSGFQPRSYVQATGNYKLSSTRSNIFTRDSANYHQQLNGQHFFFINIFDNDGDPTDALITKAINWLDQELDNYHGYKFIVSHYPIYSTGTSSPIQSFTTQMEHLIDTHNDTTLLGMFGGESDAASVFRRKNVQIIMAGNGGDAPCRVNESVMLGDRVWNAESLSGPLVQDDSAKLGYQYHLNSWLKNTRTEVTLVGQQITYLVRDLQTWKVLASYNYLIEMLFSWGPIVTPKDNGANITWWTSALVKTQVCIDRMLYYGTNNLKDTKTHTGCGYSPPVSRTHFHQIFVDRRSFTAVIEGHTINFDNYPRSSHNFLITSDAHEDGAMVSKSIQGINSFDFHISGGDETRYQMAVEYMVGFAQWHQKPFSQAVGNHESFAKLRQFGQREYNYYQNIQGLNFYFIFVFNQSHIDALNDSQINATMKWLEAEVAKHTGPSFIVSHSPIYSPGKFGSYPLFTRKMEAFLDAHADKQILAVISGHEHFFSAFKRKDVLFLIAATNGGFFTRVNNVDTMGDRIWNAQELHGPLSGLDSGKSIGYEYHLDSWLKFTRTEVTMKNGLIRYTVRNLVDWAVLAQYEQTYSK